MISLGICNIIFWLLHPPDFNILMCAASSGNICSHFHITVYPLYNESAGRAWVIIAKIHYTWGWTMCDQIWLHRRKHIVRPSSIITLVFVFSLHMDTVESMWDWVAFVNKQDVMNANISLCKAQMVHYIQHLLYGGFTSLICLHFSFNFSCCPFNMPYYFSASEPN